MNFSIDIVKATEAGAIAASKWIGSGKKEEADKAATDALKYTLDYEVEFAGKVIMGEGEKDKSFGLFYGDKVGKLAHIWETNPSRYKQLYGDKKINWYDVAVDPVEGTTQTVISGPEAMSVMAIGPRDSMFKTDYFYMNKIVYGKKIRDKVELSLAYPLEENLRLTSEALGKPISDLMVCVLDRPRHYKIIKKLRALNVRIKLLRDCDIAGAVAACLLTSDVDFLYGIGGSPEAVISVAAIKTLGGDTEAQIYDKDMMGHPDPSFGDDEEPWFPVGDVIPSSRLIAGPCVFAATGITDGTILKGIKHTSSGVITNSVFMKSDTKTIRWFDTHHGIVR